MAAAQARKHPGFASSITVNPAHATERIDG